MTRDPTGRVRSLAIVGGVSLLLALALGVPELAAIGAGAAVLLVVGLLTAGEAMMELSVGGGQVRVVEGEPVRITARARRPIARWLLWLSAAGPMEIGYVGSSLPARVTPSDRGFTVELRTLDGPAPD